MIKKGPTIHKMFLGFEGDVETYYRGYYDPIQNLVSIAVPQPIYKGFGAIPVFTEDDIPEEIKNALREQFGNEFIFKIF